VSHSTNHYINTLNREEDERQREERAQFKRQERMAGERWDEGMSLKVIDPRGGRKRQIINPPVHCVQCGESVSTLIFCSDECRRNYDKDMAQWLDGIDELLPSARKNPK
jgi:endogenous inhibitor of DNA gyrase (YacG/DUF329 family)